MEVCHRDTKTQRVSTTEATESHGNGAHAADPNAPRRPAEPAEQALAMRWRRFAARGAFGLRVSVSLWPVNQTGAR